MSQERRDFLKFSGLFGALSLLDAKSVWAGVIPQAQSACVLIPSETDGPFPLDLSANKAFFRRDIREAKTGAPLQLKLRIKDAHTCKPLPNARVNIWHCDKDGNYSGYMGEEGQTYLRGYQITDAKGEVLFTTVFPGWYPGRTSHIHFQVYVSSTYSVVSQLTFPNKAKNDLYAAHAGLYPRGADPIKVERDYLFSDGYALQLASLMANPNTGIYTAELELSVDGQKVGQGHIEAENARQFQWGHINHEPIRSEIVAPITLKHAAKKVSLEWWSAEGQRLACESQPNLPAGFHRLALAWPKCLSGDSAIRPISPYNVIRVRGSVASAGAGLFRPFDGSVCQIVVENAYGEFKSFQVMPMMHEPVMS